MNAVIIYATCTMKKSFPGRGVVIDLAQDAPAIYVQK